LLNAAVLVLPAAALAGAAGILLELSWLRIAAAALPGTLPAAALVVPVFLAGWTLGSLLAGRYADRENGTAAAAAGWLALSAVAAALLPRLGLAFLPADGAATLFHRVWAGGLPVFPVAIGLGGALPLLARVRLAAGLSPARATGAVAAAGALGGAAACAAWVPLMTRGFDAVIVSAMGLALAAVVCWLLQLLAPSTGRAAAGADQTLAESSAVPPSSAALARGRGLLLMISAALARGRGLLLMISAVVAGALLVSGQLSALRVHAQSWGDSMVTTAEILGGLHVGMALGAALLCLQLSWLPAVLLVSGLALIAGLSSLAPGHLPLAGGSLMGAAWLTVPLGFGAGSLVTAACRERFRPASRLGSWVGDLAALSALGGALGGWAHSQWLLGSTTLGTGGALRLSALTAFGLSALLALSALMPRRGRMAAILLVPASVALLVFAWDRETLTMPWGAGADDMRLLSQGEGPYGVISLVEAASGEQRLMLDDRFGLGGSGAALLEQRLGRLAACLQPTAKRALLLGLGRGHSLAGLSSTTRAQVDCVERNAQILDLKLPLPFLPGSGPRFGDPEVIHAEARSWISEHPQQYDLVVGDLVFPWIQGAGELLGAEQFHRMRRALADGGVYVQWLPLHQLTWAAFGSVTSAFLQAFPTARLFIATPLAGQPLVALVGGLNGGLPDPSLVDELLEDVPTQGGLNAAVDLFDLHVAGAWALTTSFAEEQPNSSAWPGSELLTLRRQDDQAGIARRNLRLLAELLEPLTTEGLQRAPIDRQERRELGRELVSRSEALRALLLARSALAELAALDPEDLDHGRRGQLDQQVDSSLMAGWRAFPGHIGVRQVMLERSGDLIEHGRWDMAAGLLRAAVDEHADVSLAAVLGGVLVRLERPEDAVKLLRAARRAEPDNIGLLLNLAAALLHTEQDAEARLVLERARDVLGSGRLPPLHGTALGVLEQQPGAEEQARRALQSIPEHEAWAACFRRLLAEG
jgi:spermidine synthase